MELSSWRRSIDDGIETTSSVAVWRGKEEESHEMAGQELREKKHPKVS
jgi:hypothetical protein